MARKTLWIIPIEPGGEAELSSGGSYWEDWLQKQPSPEQENSDAWKDALHAELLTLTTEPFK